MPQNPSENATQDAEQEAMAAKAQAEVAEKEASQAIVDSDVAESFATDAIHKAENAAISAETASAAGAPADKGSLSQAGAAITEAKEAIQIAESARGQAESARNKAEQARFAAEHVRNIAEEARVDAEETRTVAETIRGSEEDARIKAEEAKRQAEIALKNSELAKQESAQALLDAETALEKANLAMKGLELKQVELQKKQQELKDHVSSLEVINRDLEQFASLASHDLQAPLRKIKTFSEQVEKEAQGKLSPESLDGLARIRKSTESMQYLISDFLALARASHIKPFEPLDLSALVAETLSRLEEPIQEKKAVIEIGALPPIIGDKTQLQQVIQNLVENALKFQSPGTAPLVKIASQALSGDRIQISVADNGIGFDQKQAERIFEPFERLHGVKSYPGTGIGLAICKRVAERHGGYISAKSVVGQGSVFTIILPADPQQAPDTAA